MNSKIRNFLIHLCLVILTFLLISYCFFYIYLPSITLHGETIEVPDLKGLTVEESKDILNQIGLNIKISDSTYSPNAPARTVISNTPNAKERVKRGRTIYVVISSRIPPKVKMPKLTGTSLKSAMMVINSYGLKLGNVTYKPGAYEGTVLFQMVNNTNIGDDVYIEKGTTIDLVVSSGTSNEEVEVPMLVGLTLKEARTLILESGLELGSVVYSTQNGYKEGIVFKQKPESTSQGQAIKVKMGTEIDIWVSGSEPSSP